MNNIDGVQPPSSAKPIVPVAPIAQGPSPTQPAEISDVVEISQAARLAAKVHDIPDVRADLVARVKAEIQAGAYETPERLEIAVNGLMEEFFPNL